MNGNILSFVQARVETDKWADLVKEYDQVEKRSLPSAVLKTYLVQDKNEQAIWRIVTVWESLEAMTEYRSSVETPVWIQLFKNVGAMPELVVNEVKLSK